MKDNVPDQTDLAAFRSKIRNYCRAVGQTQKALAVQLGVNSTVLSTKLNGTDNARLTVPEIRQIIRVLTEWEALNTQSEVLELLTLSNCPNFSVAEWELSPLNRLEVDVPQVADKHIAHHNTAKINSNVKPPDKPRHLNLPAQLTPLIDRQAVIQAACQLLQKNDVRFLTLTGTGGIGKTRIALKVAAELSQYYTGGVYFVALAAITDPARLLPTIMQALKLEFDGTKPVFEVLCDFLADRQILLVLDNFEQIAGAVHTVSELLATAPGLKILVTSRVVLHAYGEHLLEIPPFTMPPLDAWHKQTLDELAGYEAVQLFIQRAINIRPDFQLSPENALAVIRICHFLEGLPLAIELAAAWSRIYSPSVLLEKLESGGKVRLNMLNGGAVTLPLRHQTLRNTLDWSYAFLTAEQKQLLGQLGIFVGGFSVEAVQHICLEEASGNALQLLLELADKSMVRPVANSVSNEPRFEMLETVREFAYEQLEAANLVEVLHERHFDYFQKLAQTFVTKEREGLDHKLWIARMEAEHTNLLMALEWGASQPLKEIFEATLGLAGDLRVFWETHGLTRFGLAKLPVLLERAYSFPCLKQTNVYANFLNAVGKMYWFILRYDQAQPYHQEALEIFCQNGEYAGIAFSLHSLAMSVTHNCQQNFE